MWRNKVNEIIIPRAFAMNRVTRSPVATEAIDSDLLRELFEMRVWHSLGESLFAAERLALDTILIRVNVYRP